VLILFGISASDAPSSRPSPSPNASQPSTPNESAILPTLTIATFNVNFANSNVAEVVDLIRQSEADAVCLQETNRSFERSLSRELDEEYSFRHFRGGTGKYGAERFGFMSKSPLNGFRYLRARHGIFGTWIAEVRFDGRPVQLVNVHLEPFRLQASSSPRHKWAVFRATEGIHEREIEWIYDKIRKDMPTVLAGDFNSLSFLAAPGFLRKQGFIDSFAAVTERPDLTSTWKWGSRDHTLTARIDYLFHSSHFRTVRSRVLEAGSSDHNLLVSTLTWSADPDGHPSPQSQPH
jgi:endonuclease/exonuclease/phosphatase (EEP) superfamily protein YafD